MKLARLLVFCLFCFAGIFSNVANAQDNVASLEGTTDASLASEYDATTGSVQSEEAYLSEEGPGQVGKNSWQRGWDIRLSLGFKSYLNSRTPAAFNAALDLGYRWKKASLYLHLDNAVGPDNYNLQPVSYNYSVGLKNLYYIYLTGNWEMILGYGLMYTEGNGLNLPLTAGFAWHLNDVALGVDITYQPGIYFLTHGILPGHDMRVNFVVGYNF